MTLPAIRYTIFPFVILAILFSPMASYAKQRVIVEVAGVSCPFCAFGLEKKLNQLPGAERVTIKINEAKAEIEVGDGKEITREQIEQAVKESGFTPGKIDIKEEKERAP
ncbi:MAG TPA: heavy-metal-associated domain-containing protein [Nitrospiria bacterium]|nr:heavy-metal-associated domain-containing protein [Nitrospiria bacterium]